MLIGIDWRIGALAVALFVSGFAKGASTVEQFTVNQLVLDATRYNGCLARVSPSPTTFFANCAANYVTLGCDGLAGPSKSAALNNLSAAQLSFVTDTKVYMRLYDVAPEGQSYCLVDRVDNTKIAID